MNEDYDAGRSPKIRPHWNRPQAGNVNEWPVNRALTVLHVYTCLALFFAAVAERSAGLEVQYGPLYGVDPAKQVRRSLDRAHYLRHQLEQYEECLGFAGRLFVNWLGEMLRSFDPASPLEGSHLHLLLDRYEREVDELRVFVGRSGRGALPDDLLWGESIREVARREVSSALAVLFMIAEPASPLVSELQNYDADLVSMEAAKASFRDSAEVFLSVRSSVSETMRSVTTTAHLRRLSGGAENILGDLIREMVKGSSVYLNGLFSVALI